MNEALFQFIWKFKLYDAATLQTTKGELVQVISVGQHNQNSGPDFSEAKIKIGDTLWVGNVELHLAAEDWQKHKHNSQKDYSNIILHVLYEPILSSEALPDVPTLVLQPFISQQTLMRYARLAENKCTIPCASFFAQQSELSIKQTADAMLYERLQAKQAYLEDMLAYQDNDWENVLFQLIARYLGASVNKEPFQQLAALLPISLLGKHVHDPLQIEALVFGQAGFLEEQFQEPYPDQLRKEYMYLKRLYDLKHLDKNLFKFLRLRPSNFPTVRLAQLAAMMVGEVKLFSALLEAKTLASVYCLLEAPLNEYWKTHYQFDKFSPQARTKLGTNSKQILVINAIVPILFTYGKYKGDEQLCDRAISFLESCEPESNAIVTAWRNLNWKPENACDTQAMLQLKSEYCAKFRCLECGLGLKILQGKVGLKKI